MANVSFKRGLSTALSATGFAAQDGVFYLTTDTHRLYVGQGSNLVELNRYVKYVNTINNFPKEAADGDFAFASATNTLAVYKAGVWTQINAPDGNDNTKVTSVSDMKVAATDDGITVSFNINQKTSDSSGTTNDEAAVPVSFTISNANLATANKVAVGLGAKNTTTGAELATSGSGSAATPKVALKSGANVTITADSSNNVTIAAKDTTYTLGATAADGITLTADGTVQNVPVKAGAKMSVSVADGAITVAHAGLTAPTHTDKTADANKVAIGDNGTFNAITAITAADGHITGYTTQKYQLPKDSTYELNPLTGGVIQLKDNGGTTQDITIAAGQDAVVATDTAARSISIAHKTYTAATKASSAKDTAPGSSGTFTVVDGLKVTNGHVEEIYTKQVSMPDEVDTKNESARVVADNAGNLTIGITDTDGTEITGTAKNALYFTVNGNKVYNQGTIDFYTKSQIDSKLQGINAMVYRGTVGTGGDVASLPTTGVAIGDTYMVASEGSYHDAKITCKVGDLLIATGTETNGVITSGLKWSYVPSGDDTDTHYTLNVASGKITLHNETTGTDVASATIAAGKDLGVSTSGSTITVAHNTISTTNAGAPTTANITPTFGGSINVVSAVTVANGHVTNVKTDKVQLPTPVDTEGTLTLKAAHILNNTTNNGSEQNITFANDGYITLTDDVEKQKMTIGHKAYSGTYVSAGAGITPNSNRQFTVVSGVSRDGGGHVSGVTTSVVTLPVDNNTTYDLSVDTEKKAIKLTGSDGNDTSIPVIAGTAATVSAAAAGITVGHANVGHTPATGTDTLTAAGTFDAIDSITVNAQGHVTGYRTKTFTMPADSEFELSSSVATATNGATFTSKLKNTTSGNDAGSAGLTVSSTSLKVAAGANAMSIDLEWGTF